MSKGWYFIRQTIYTIFSFCFFLIAALFLTLYGFILITLGGASKEHKRKYHRVLQRLANFVINHVPGTHFSYSNPHNELFEKPSIIISNHQSHLDLMAIMMLSPNIIILTKNWVWHNPFYGFIIRYADFFPISETGEMIKSLEAKVKEGYSVMIFPEGTRSPDCSIQRFHRGAFYLAEQLQLDIIPVYIKGFGNVLPKTSFHLHPGRMSIEIMEKISCNTFSPEYDYRQMTKKIHRMYIEKDHEEMCNNW